VIQKTGNAIFLSVLVLALFVSNAHAGGLELYELGTPGVGLASAGEAARAQDASTLFTNPAGMSRLERSEVTAGLQPLYGDAHFDRDENTSTPGSSSGNPVGFLPGASMFYVNRLSEDWSVGLGSFSYFGLPLEFDNDWSGRYYAQDTAMLGLTFMPSIAYKFSNQLSVGAGLNAMYGIFREQAAVNNIDPRLGDGKVEISDGDWGFGADVGIMYQISDRSRLGLRYLSQVNLDFSDSPEYTNLGPAYTQILTGSRRLDLGVTVPTEIMLSGFHELDDEWAVLASAGWQDWSKFGRVDVAITSADAERTSTLEVETKDTWHASIGLQNRTCADWIFSAGIAYDSSMLDDEDRPVTLPVGESWRFGAGSQYLLNADVTLGFAYELQFNGDMMVNQERGPLAGRVSGEYGDTILHYWALSLQYKFD
jgi:long-chain fatty acid transport protein